ncbi:MAG: sigma-70 family RNA polymerase sigma factor [bacterium]|nr:sigma-70 family RNA polymerase sigma factor [bacterium]
MLSENSNREAFNREVLALKNKLYGAALLLTNNDDDARDLVQEAYLKAFRFYEKYELGTNMNGWLFTMMKNIFINDYRKKKKQPSMIEFYEVEPFLNNIKLNKDITNDDYLTILSNSFSDEMKNALSKLPDKYKSVLKLSALGDFSYKEIADILEIPIGTVRSRLSRARKAMSISLTKDSEINNIAVHSNAA